MKIVLKVLLKMRMSRRKLILRQDLVVMKMRITRNLVVYYLCPEVNQVNPNLNPNPNPKGALLVENPTEPHHKLSLNPNPTRCSPFTL
jgi:hypothetical protein